MSSSTSYDYKGLNNEEETSNNESNNETRMESSILINDESSTEALNVELENEIIPVKPKKKRLYWADCARIFSMVAIILLHSASFDCELGLKRENKSSWVIVCFYNCITRFGVPMFVLLSGTFILDPSKKFSFKKLLRHNILRLATAFAFWSTINALLNIFTATNKIPFMSKEFLIEFLKKFIVGEEYLWFIFMIIGCYLIAPFLRYFSDDVVIARYFLGLCVFWGSLIPTLGNIFSGYELKESENELNVWISRWHFHFTLEFVGYFVAGYHLVKHVEIKSIGTRVFIYVLGLLDVGLLYFLTYNIEANDPKNNYSHHFRGTNTLTVAFYAVVLFIFFKHEIGRINFSERAIKIITKWSSLTFGMYLSHLVIKAILAKFLGTTQSEFLHIISYSPVIGVPILWVILTVLSTLLSYILSLTPILNKYVI
ncbi:hypothetical protein H8356DRAFT_1649662 [Neocallimastix lanati (nom. inval.)]|jgi:surface polysaccharide O-acyltransferase-like enzyme|uniref:Acyltransferase 3 domain-containing protein n=1 Tax=Neocallimastix californiae TaxID=1754190 RepID=A0A1Y2AGP9_9FUNG|nr:hypothetical protein H8356DRAFT_1649662 [Neocallimastix sp. JGI-2020a]ORY21135.1 hypothetical protein LY90DRAFT_516293 [Neocallimastix californiae]|eukprot:ORY21135.1 hypothetical protein LY90DRAFT_516293 [Neocallimastix californiae]